MAGAVKVAVLAGGVGGARMAAGLASVVRDPGLLAVIVNTGDDEIFYGLHVSPDLDTVMYTLAGLVSRETGWGVDGDTDGCLRALARWGEPAWFYLGDQDLATHILRTWWLRQGRTLSGVTAELARRLGVTARILPMSDDPVRTRVTVELEGAEQELPFQVYFVQHRAALPVRRVRFEGIERARPAPGVLEALDEADVVVIAPSNPVVSIAPILALPGVRESLARRRRRVAVSPLAAGRAFKGPAVEMMQGLGLRPEAAGVAAFYRGLIDLFVIDPADEASAPEIEAMGVRPV
ncbi:MAG: 2-phospho-L-lactate transferase, partial [Bacillota bacterium]